MEQFKKEFEDTISIAQRELSEHKKDWEDRYIDYLKKTNGNISEIMERRSKFHKWGPLSIYSTIGLAKNNSRCFDIRYQGQSVGNISVTPEFQVLLHISESQYSNNCNKKYFDGYPIDCKPTEKTQGYDWKKAPEARLFREYFKKDLGKKGHPEHRCENLLLKHLTGRVMVGEQLLQIQPVTITKDLFFQMPTPLTASGNKVRYSDGHGGIDILARCKRGNKTTLTLFELKDEPDNPNKVIKQAIAYATFIVELCKTSAQNDFWKLCFPENSKAAMTGNDVINVSVLLPEQESMPSFVNKELAVPGSDIKLKLHCTYFKLEGETAVITQTSLLS